MSPNEIAISVCIVSIAIVEVAHACGLCTYKNTHDLNPRRPTNIENQPLIAPPAIQHAPVAVQPTRNIA